MDNPLTSATAIAGLIATAPLACVAAYFMLKDWYISTEIIALEKEELGILRDIKELLIRAH